ncbi:hypothetical protein TWF718_002593 [Orbilia javanica]|uniref:DUF7704 domain-containing protein n=1 Tax=Orbilia javanica TaxID=47235 RepID=A0AAN8RJV8_9PEZI
MVQHVLPTIPWILSGLLEPAGLASRYNKGPDIYQRLFPLSTLFKDPHEYLRSLGPTPSVYNPDDTSATGAILTLVNFFLYSAAVQFLCCHVASEPGLARAYLKMTLFFDYGHVWASYKGIGYDLLISPWDWNFVTVVNIGVVCVLHLLRITYLSGLFGKDNDIAGRQKYPAKKVE